VAGKISPSSEADGKRLLGRRAFCRSALSTVACAAGISTCSTQKRPPNLVLIVMDTLRADHLSCWGYHRKTSPHIDAYARNSTVYTQARSTSPWTLPAHTTLFTGQYSFEHGMEAHAYKDASGKTVIGDPPPLPDSATILPETLKAAGYDTAAFSANIGYLSEYWNLNQGFDEYVAKVQLAPDVLGAALHWLDDHKRRPFFLFCNLMDAHIPYNITQCPGTFDWPVAKDPELCNQLAEAVLPGIRPADEALVRQVVGQYDMAVANLDYAFSQFLAQLKRMGIYDNTLIVLTSDHGEYLGEHLLVQHSKDLYEEVLHVPLILKFPHQQAEQRIDTPVSLVQVYGTMLHTLGIGASSKVPILDRPQPLLAELNYSREKDINHPVWGKRFRRVRTASYEMPWKLIHSRNGQHELYNLDEDPSESTNLFSSSPDRAQAMLARLAAIKPLSKELNAPPADVPPPMSDEVREALKANGYL